jgi:hypothetical protein
MTHATSIHNELHNMYNSPNIIRINISMSEMSGACSTHGGWENTKVRYHMGGVRRVGKLILKWIRKEQETGELSRYSDGLQTARLGFDSRKGQDFYLLRSVQICSGAHPSSHTIGTGGCFLVIKQPGCEADHSPPSSAEAMNSGAIKLHSPIRLHGIVLN